MAIYFEPDPDNRGWFGEPKPLDEADVQDGDFYLSDEGKTYQRICGRWVWLIPMWVPAEEVE